MGGASGTGAPVGYRSSFSMSWSVSGLMYGRCGVLDERSGWEESIGWTGCSWKYAIYSQRGLSLAEFSGECCQGEAVEAVSFCFLITAAMDSRRSALDWL